MPELLRPQARRSRIPWSKILTTLKVYANSLHQFGALWTYFMVVIYGPTYVKYFHNLDSIQVGYMYDFFLEYYWNFRGSLTTYCLV